MTELTNIDISSFNEYEPKKNMELPFGNYLWLFKIDGISVLTSIASSSRTIVLTPVTVPDFSYWDGYKLNLPNGLKYKKIDTDFPISKYEIKIADNNLLKCCPFCSRKPKIISNRVVDNLRNLDDASDMISENFSFDFHLECCDFISRYAYFKSLKKLIESWNKRI